MQRTVGLDQQVIEELKGIAKRHRVEKLILFGSRARGDHTRVSDIDLAIYGGDQVMFQLDVLDEVSTLLQFDFVDMDSCRSEMLIFEVQKGVVLYEKV